MTAHPTDVLGIHVPVRLAGVFVAAAVALQEQYSDRGPLPPDVVDLLRIASVVSKSEALSGSGAAQWPHTDNRDTVTRQQAADALDLTPERVSQLVTEGRLVDASTGRDVAITTASLDHELARRTA